MIGQELVFGYNLGRLEIERIIIEKEKT